MKWTALNGVGALFWLMGLATLGVLHAGSWGLWLPVHSLPVGALLGLLGLITLLWANLGDA